MLLFEDIVQAAIKESQKSPCFSKRGVALFNNKTLEAIGVAYNSPPRPSTEFSCTKDLTCKKTCSKFAVHAEQRVLLKFPQESYANVDLLHIKTVGKQGVPSGPPSCPDCSKLIVENKISGVWLYHENGWQRYSSTDFHKKTLEFCTTAHTINLHRS